MIRTPPSSNLTHSFSAYPSLRFPGSASVRGTYLMYDYVCCTYDNTVSLNGARVYLALVEEEKPLRFFWFPGTRAEKYE